MSTSRSLNKVMLIGNLTRNPVLKDTNSGSVVCTFGIATNTTWKDAEGNLQERTEFHNVVAWNKLGEICAQILATGMLVYVEGELRTRVWDDEGGIRHYRTEVKIDDMKLLDKKDKQGVGIAEAKSEVKQEDKKREEKKEDKSNTHKQAKKEDDDEDEKEDKDEKKDEKKGTDSKNDAEIEQEAEDLF